MRLIYFRTIIGVKAPSQRGHFKFTTMADEVTFDYVKSLENDKSVLLIDVREPTELENKGKIPWSINIPLATVEDTLKTLSDEDFQKKFGRNKPNLDSSMVFHCQLGGRSRTALNTAKSLGYINAKHFPGGWAEWEKQTKK